jgi:hypothetical protein
MKQYVLMIIIMTPIIASIIWLYLFQTAPKDFKEPIETIGTVLNFINATRGSDAEIIYYVEGKEYVTKTLNDEGMAKGDRYILIFEKENPQKCEVLLERPVFLNGEEVRESEGIIKKVSKIAKDFVRYEYIIEGKTYSRTQLLSKEFKPIVGQKYVVYYWVENPQRAIIYLDKLLQK